LKKFNVISENLYLINFSFTYDIKIGMFIEEYHDDDGFTTGDYLKFLVGNKIYFYNTYNISNIEEFGEP